MKQHFEALVLPDGMRAVPVFIGTFLCVVYAGRSRPRQFGCRRP
jgi:hypothetical protein